MAAPRSLVPATLSVVVVPVTGDGDADAGVVTTGGESFTVILVVPTIEALVAVMVALPGAAGAV